MATKQSDPKEVKEEKKPVEVVPVDPRVPAEPRVEGEPKQSFDDRTPGTPPWLDENGKQVNGASESK